MPELPEVETVRRGLTPAMEGAVIVQRRCQPARSALAFPTQHGRAFDRSNRSST